MGECIIASGRTLYIPGSAGSNITASAPPVLNSSNPADNTMKALDSVTLFVFVEENNVNCSYQWFVNDVLIPGATEQAYVYTTESKDDKTTYSIKCAVSNSKGTTYSREATMTVWPTRWYIIKNYSIVDETATLTTPYGSTYVQIDDTTIYSSAKGNRYCELNSDIFALELYTEKFCAKFNYNSYWNKNLGLTFGDGDYWTYSQSGLILDISSASDPLSLIEVYIGSTTEGSQAYIQLEEVYIE